MVTALVLAGCSSPSAAPVDEAVADLVADLSSGSFDSGVITDPTDAEIWHAYALGPLIDVGRTVEAGDVVVDGETVDLSLTWTFQLTEGAAVSAPAHATLTWVDGAWHLAWEPTVLHEAATAGSRYEVTTEEFDMVVILRDASQTGTNVLESLRVGAVPRG